MQNSMCGDLIIEGRYLKSNGFLVAWVIGDMPERTDIGRVSSENEAPSAAWD